ncbi:MAG: hypothetical protein HC925_03780 [Coleofasciculaceae cyanobacterium SM2_3_26]|nr:hypothetical protein [Coleofasciculaceae cyanobacterium SM2_3_26]
MIAAFGFNPQSATEHFIRFGAAEGRATNLFNPLEYLNNFADLRAAFGNDLFAATQHFIQTGFAEGRTDD